MSRIGDAADPGLCLGVLIVADALSFLMLPAMYGSGPSPFLGAKRRCGAVSDVRPATTATQEPEQGAPGNAGITLCFHSHVRSPASLS